MRLSVEKVKEFQRLYKEHFFAELSFEDAYEIATRFVALVAAVYKTNEKRFGDPIHR